MPLYRSTSRTVQPIRLHVKKQGFWVTIWCEKLSNQYLFKGDIPCLTFLLFHVVLNLKKTMFLFHHNLCTSIFVVSRNKLKFCHQLNKYATLCHIIINKFLGLTYQILTACCCWVSIYNITIHHWKPKKCVLYAS